MKRQAGFSLLELSVSLVVLGLVALLLIQFLGRVERERHAVAQRGLLQRADDALLVFAMINHRLPCPAASDGSGDGEESCQQADGAPRQVGALPYRSLGLPDLGARRVRYGVLRRPDPDDAMLDADLAVDRDRYKPLVVIQERSYLAGAVSQGAVNGLDFCQALRTAMRQPPDAAYLHATRHDPPHALGRNLGYALALPARDAPAAGDSPAFSSPRRPLTAEVQEQGRVVGSEQLWARMRCGDNLSATGHAHFNAALAASILRTALHDYRQQQGLQKQLANAGVARGGSGIAEGVGASADAAAGVADAVAETLASTGLTGWRVGLAAVAVVAAAGLTINASASAVQAVRAKQDADDAAQRIDALVGEADTLQPLVRAQATAADAAGLY